MKNAARLALRMFMAALLTFDGAASAADATSTQRHAPSQSTTDDRNNSIASWARVLDSDLPLAERRNALAAIEQGASTADQHQLYALGSLYHMGRHSPDSPIAQDTVKASLYLGNAVMRGSILAMAKMAELKLAAHQYREAMNWAQIYAHYESLLPDGQRPQRGYAAELVMRITDRLGRSAMPGIMRDVSAFIAMHDAQIKAGADSGTASAGVTGKRKAYLPPASRLAPHAGFADYLLAFRADGGIAAVRLLDAVPDPALGAILHKYAGEMTTTPTAAGAGTGLRYAWQSVMYDDGRYRARPTP